MIKKAILPLLIIAALSGCKNEEKAQENALLDSVTVAHDKVMSDDDATMKARAKLKLLLAKKPELKDSVNYYLKKLDDNDNLMMDWMNKFNPDFKGKSHEQIISYLNAQKKQVMEIDSQLREGSHMALMFYIRHITK